VTFDTGNLGRGEAQGWTHFVGRELDPTATLAIFGLPGVLLETTASHVGRFTTLKAAGLTSIEGEGKTMEEAACKARARGLMPGAATTGGALGPVGIQTGWPSSSAGEPGHCTRYQLPGPGPPAGRAKPAAAASVIGV
jgi:hypothetical protein